MGVMKFSGSTESTDEAREMYFSHEDVDWINDVDITAEQKRDIAEQEVLEACPCGRLAHFEELTDRILARIADGEIIEDDDDDLADHIAIYRTMREFHYEYFTMNQKRRFEDCQYAVPFAIGEALAESNS